jgi:ATP-dependent DNA helicase RecG
VVAACATSAYDVRRARSNCVCCGLSDLKIADVVRDAEILAEAREAAFAVAEADPRLDDPTHAAMRRHFARTAPKSLGFARVG